jgi:hypothetical protein
VYAGVTDVTDGTAQNTWPSTRHVLKAKMIKQHPDYNPTSNANNIALVYLPVDLYYSKNTAILNLYLKDPEIATVLTASFIGKTAKVAGWGQTAAASGSPLSNTLKTTDLTIVDFNTCDYYHSKFYNGCSMKIHKIFNMFFVLSTNTKSKRIVEGYIKL